MSETENTSLVKQLRVNAQENKPAYDIFMHTQFKCNI